MFAFSALARTSGRALIANQQVAALATLSGKVKWFDVKKGFGFIVSDDNQDEDFFVHQSSIYAAGFRSLAEGEPVEFEVDVDQQTGRSKAINVTGPLGSYVQGAPRRNFDSPDRDSGFGGYGDTRRRRRQQDDDEDFAPRRGGRNTSQSDKIVSSGSYSLYDDNDDENNTANSRVSGNDLNEWLKETDQDTETADAAEGKSDSGDVDRETMDENIKKA